MRRAAYALAALALGVALFYLRCVRAPAPPPPSLSVAWMRDSLVVGGRTRSYGVYAPASLPRGAPLLLVFHGSDQMGEP